MSDLFKLNWTDIGRGVAMAVLGAFLSTFLTALQVPGFQFDTIDWQTLLRGALVAGVAYLVKNFFSDNQGKLGGVL